MQDPSSLQSLWALREISMRHPLLRTIDGPGGIVRAIAFAPDGATFASAGGDSVIRIWDAQTFRRPATLEGHAAEVAALPFHPRGALLASSDRAGTILIWDLPSGRVRKRLDDHAGTARWLDFSPDGTLVASASLDETIRLWTARGPPRVLPARPFVRLLAFSPMGETLYCGHGDASLQEWDLATATCVAVERRPNVRTRNLVLSRDGRTLLLGGWYTVDVWATSPLRLRRVLRLPEAVWGLDLSPDRRLVTVGHDHGRIDA